MLCAKEECIRDLRTWLIEGKLLLNDDETESLVIGTSQQFNKLGPLSLQVGDHNIDPSFNVRYLEAVIDNSPSMNKSVKPVSIIFLTTFEFQNFCQRNVIRH